MQEYIGCLKKYACFSGRACRREYWMFVLFNLTFAFVAGFVDGFIGAEGVISGLYSLAVLLPGIAVTIRRLHDTGRSGWWWLIVLVPIVGAIVLLVFECQDSQPGTNEYGSNPKGL